MSVVAHETDEDLPAWSLPASAGESIHLPSVWPERVTRGWAFGGATGAGVRVCVLDSGVESAHPPGGAGECGVCARAARARASAGRRGAALGGRDEGGRRDPRR